MDLSNKTIDDACWDTYKVVNRCSWEFILKTVTITIIIIGILLGNSLVITSVLLYQRLRRSISNSFIASLAVADLLVAIFVLPFSLADEVMGYWLFGDFLCRTWLVVDVWFCTASILHLCAISIDRYVAIAHPLRYPNLMTHRRCRLTCLAMWILSFIICFPALINWGSDSADGDTELTTNLTTNNTSTMNTPPECGVTYGNSPGYTIYSAMGSFFIPSFVLCGFYVKIFLLTRKFLHQSQSGAIRSTQNGHSVLRIHRGGATYKDTTNNLFSYEKHHLITPTQLTDLTDDGSKLADIDTNSVVDHTNLARHSGSSQSIPLTLTLDSRRPEAAPRLTRKPSRTNMGHTMNKETRAAKTVAIIVGCFIVCWAPFFVCYVIVGVSDYKITEPLFNVFFWIGYINSLINPCVYALFSMDYRHAFKKILRCQVKRSVVQHQRRGLRKYMTSLYLSSSSNGRTEGLVSKPRSQKLNSTHVDDTVM